jgi:hypothetical protein
MNPELPYLHVNFGYRIKRWDSPFLVAAATHSNPNAGTQAILKSAQSIRLDRSGSPCVTVGRK